MDIISRTSVLCFYSYIFNRISLRIRFSLTFIYHYVHIQINFLSKFPPITVTRPRCEVCQSFIIFLNLLFAHCCEQVQLIQLEHRYHLSKINNRSFNLEA